MICRISAIIKKRNPLILPPVRKQQLVLITKHFYTMSKYPKIGIRPTIDGRQGGVREKLASARP